jgi:dihydrofolate synthase/folylpolyglutamate synthase
MTQYNQTIDRLFQASFAQSAKTGLDNAHALDCQLNCPASSYSLVHVAGSNGKGSVATKIAKVLELSGYCVGVYTSPHLFCFRERIAVNGKLIPEEDVVEGMQKIFAVVEKLGLSATFFELATFLAFDYFRKRGVDAAVIETGLGGRFDATNVISPVLSVITSISREHVNLLGGEVELIAAEKAGIIKENIPVVLGPKARYQSIYDKARQMNSPVFASKKISYFFDEENSAVAQLALESLALHFKIDPEALREGLSVRPPCRFERIGNVILDVAHNPEAIFSLLQALHTFFPRGKFRFLVGFSKDKEYDRCLDLIADIAVHIHLVQAKSPRAATTQELEVALEKEDPHLHTSYSSVKEGVAAACEEALAKGEILVICGSFYIMADAKAQLPKDSLDLNEKILRSALSSAST